MGGESLLNELHMWRSDWKIMVKVYKRWETTNADDHKWIDFILVDEEVRSFLYHFFSLVKIFMSFSDISYSRICFAYENLGYQNSRVCWKSFSSIL